jgi:hypothetical protein
MGDYLLDAESGVGIEQSESVSEWLSFFAEISGRNVQVVTANPNCWEPGQKFDRVVCTPPFGNLGDENDGIARMLALMSENAKAALVVPVARLWHKRGVVIRRMIEESSQVLAIISLPGRFWPDTSIETAVLLLGKTPALKAYMARAKTAADLDAIANDYSAWITGRSFSLGFEAALNIERWDMKYYEPVDFELGEIDFPYSTMELGDVASVSTANPDGKATIAMNRTGSKAVWLEDEPTLKERNNLFIVTSPRINSAYLYLYLASSVGRSALGKFIKGTSIPHVSAEDLAHVPVVLPDLATQVRISAEALELRRNMGTLESLVAEGKQALTEKMFRLGPVKAKFTRFGRQTDAAFFGSLPFPIAVVFRKVVNAPNSTQRFSLLIELFEVVIRFVVLVNLADYINGRRRESLIAQIPACQKLYAPTLGDWVNMFGSLAELKASPESVPFLREIKHFTLDKYRRTLNEFVDIRNTSFRGHGATQTEQEYELKYQEHAPKVFDLIKSLGFLANYMLVKTGPMEKEGEFFKVGIQLLMGDNPHFEHGVITSRTPFDTNRVLYLNQEQESVVLDPYIVLENCPECRRPEVLLLDKFNDRRITYLGYESGHKPSFENVTRLPLAIREAATRRA